MYKSFLKVKLFYAGYILKKKIKLNRLRILNYLPYLLSNLTDRSYYIHGHLFFRYDFKLLENN